MTDGGMKENGHQCGAAAFNVGNVIIVSDSGNQDELVSQLSCEKVMDEDTDQVTSHINMDVAKQGTANSRGVSFHIDASQIVPLTATEQSSELQDLGLTVFNQEDYEQGILSITMHFFRT